MENKGHSRLNRLVVLGNPESRRVSQFIETAQRVGGWDVNLLPYSDLFAGCANLGLLSPDAVVRIESPGGSLATTRLILKAGIESMEARGHCPLSEIEIDRWSLGQGEILSPLQWFLGLERTLNRLDLEWSPFQVDWMSSPTSIIKAFDKRACLQSWEQAGLPVPQRYEGVNSYSSLRETIKDQHARIFIKLRYGYSAIGAVALEWRGPLIRAITTVKHALAQRFFLTKKPRQIQDEREIATLIDTLAQEEIVVEFWLPKARWKSVPFDLRIVTIGQQACHVVGRAQNSPFSNLNLDGVRIGPDDVQSILGDSWFEAKRLAEQAAALNSEASYLGMDVLPLSCRSKFVLLEANAFGDDLPGLLFNGMSTYEAELRWLLARRTS